MILAAAVFVCVAFVVLARLLGLFTRPREVAEVSRRAMRLMADSALDDDAKEAGMRAHAKTLGRLFVVITGCALVALGAPLAVVWALDAAGALSFDAVLAALVSPRLLLGSIVILLAKAGYDRVARRGTV